MLDRLPAWARHFLLLLAVAVLTMAQDKLGGLHIPLELQPLVAAGITALLLTLTPLTKQYGVAADGEALVTLDITAEQEAAELAAEPLTDPISAQTAPGEPSTEIVPNRQGDF